MRQEPERGLAVGNDDSAFKNGERTKEADETKASLLILVTTFAARVTPLDPPPICELVPERSSDV